jgi:hypothetical protein
MKSPFSSQFPLEAVAWTAGLVALAFMNPYDDSGPSLCLLHHLGFKYCPGCGLGHSISFLLHGDWKGSLAAHPLGIVAVMVLTNRIRKLMTNFFNGISFSKLKF